MNDNNEIKVLDCTIRDGGYVNNWDFDLKLVRETYRALSKAGVDYVELGYHGTEKYFDVNKYGRFRFSAANNINHVCAGIDGAEVALMVDHGKYDIEDIVQYQDTPVRLIRAAFHKDKIAEALKLLHKVKQLGFAVSANFMGFASYTQAERDLMLVLLRDYPIDYAYVADTYGSMFPEQVTELFLPLLEIKTIKWGFHPHNNLQMAFANSLAAVKSGAQIVDGSIFGMGRGAGNLPTEILLSYLHHQKPDKFNVIPILNLIDCYYTNLHKKHNWGYNLPYMLSGAYGCHPSYAKDLIERKEYDIEDIWNILGVVKVNEPIGFNKELVETVLKKGLFGNKGLSSQSKKPVKPFKINSTKVGYLDRYKGKDFLVLANGPSLKESQLEIKEFIEKYQPVVLGGNYLGGLFEPQYHAFSNKRRFVDYVESVSPRSKLLIGQHIPENMIREYVSRDYETIYYEDTLENPFDIQAGIISANCRTVAVLLAGVALVMGARRLFISGMDGYMGTSVNSMLHFYDESAETNNLDALKEKHISNLKFLKQIDDYMIRSGGEGLHIITPTNYKEFYKGIKNYI